jgi:hypothetical protein
MALENPYRRLLDHPYQQRTPFVLHFTAREEENLLLVEKYERCWLQNGQDSMQLRLPDHLLLMQQHHPLPHQLEAAPDQEMEAILK